VALNDMVIKERKVSDNDC